MLHFKAKGLGLRPGQVIALSHWTRNFSCYSILFQTGVKIDTSKILLGVALLWTHIQSRVGGG